MIDIIKLRFFNTNLYWNIRHRIDRAKYTLDRLRYNTKTRREGFGLGLSIAGQITKLSFRGMFVAALALYFFETLEYLYIAYVSEFWFQLPALSNESDRFIELVSQITATMLGIYFATFGIIISSGYSKLRRDVVELLLLEKVNNFYTRWLVNVTVFCLGASWLGHLGYPTGVLVFIAASLGGVVSVLCLFTLGNRLFAFFDTTPLIRQSVVPDIERAILVCASSAIASKHIENHQQQIAQMRLETMNYLVTKTDIDDVKATDRLFEIAQQYARLLKLYAQYKPRIEPHSYWFKRKQVHKDWFSASETTTSMALSTNRQIDPEERPDLSWFEDLVKGGFLSAFTQCLNSGELGTAQRIAFAMYKTAERLAENLMLEDALGLIYEFEQELDKYTEATTSNNQKDRIENEKLLLLGLYDILSSAVRNVTIEYFRNVIIKGQNIKSGIQSLIRGSSSAQDLPNFLHKRIEKIQSWTEFERKTEGNVLTTPEFVLQYMSQGFAQHLQENLEPISHRLHRALVERVKFLQDKNPMGACQVLFGGLGSISQILFFSERVSQLATDLKANEIYTDYQVPEPDFQNFENSLAKTRDELLTTVSDKWIQDYLSSNLKHDDTIPDYYGHGYFLLAEECIAALEKNNPNLFDKLFRAFFVMANNAFSQKFHDEKKKYNDTYRIALISSAIADVLTVSGFALIYGELNNCSKLKATINDVWDRYANVADNKEIFLTKFVDLANLNVRSYSAEPRQIIRTNWKMRFEQRMREDGYGDMFDRRRRGDHPNAVVAAFHQGVMSSASDLFIAEYIVPKIDQNAELNNHIKSLVRTLKKKRQNAKR